MLVLLVIHRLTIIQILVYLIFYSPKSRGHYMYSTVVTIYTTIFNIQQFHVLPTQCIYVFCVDHRTVRV